MLRVVLLLAVAGAVAVTWWWGQSAEYSATDDKACADRSTAWAVAKVIVRENMSRTMGTKFPNRLASGGLKGMKFKYLGECRHQISAFVDTYHRLEGPGRRYFTVELSYRGRSGWILNQLDFIDPPDS